MTCEEALLAISAALDGELSPAERARLSGHLLECPQCRELAEDLRVLTDILEDSEQAPPPELAASIRRAVAEEVKPSAPPDKRRVPYLRTIAAMLALCVCLGGVGLFIYGQSKGDSAASGGAAPFKSAPEMMADGTSGGAAGGAADSCDSAAEVDDASMEPTEMPAGLGEAPVPAPSSAPAPGDRNTPNEDNTPQEPDTFMATAPEEAPSSSDSVTSDPGDTGKASITPEEALELVFEYLGGYEKYPEAEFTPIPFNFTDIQVYPPSCCLIPDHPIDSADDENTQHSSTWLTFYGSSPNGRCYDFWLFSYLTFPGFDFNRGSTLNLFTVPLDGSEVLEALPDSSIFSESPYNDPITQ